MVVSTTVFYESSDRDLERRVTAFLAGRSVPLLAACTCTPATAS